MVKKSSYYGWNDTNKKNEGFLNKANHFNIKTLSLKDLRFYMIFQLWVELIFLPFVLSSKCIGFMGSLLYTNINYSINDSFRMGRNKKIRKRKVKKF